MGYSVREGGCGRLMGGDEVRIGVEEGGVAEEGWWVMFRWWWVERGEE